MLAATAILGTLLGKRPGGYVATLALVILIAVGKEFRDLLVNPWDLPMDQLKDDIVKDLFFDSLGILCGMIFWMLMRTNEKR